MKFRLANAAMLGFVVPAGCAASTGPEVLQTLDGTKYTSWSSRLSPFQLPRIFRPKRASASSGRLFLLERKHLVTYVQLA